MFSACSCMTRCVIIRRWPCVKQFGSFLQTNDIFLGQHYTQKYNEWSKNTDERLHRTVTPQDCPFPFEGSALDPSVHPSSYSKRHLARFSCFVGPTCSCVCPIVRQIGLHRLHYICSYVAIARRILALCACDAA